MDLLFAVILALIFIMMLYAAYIIDRKKKNSKKPNLRVLVAIKRSPSGILHFIQLDSIKQNSMREELEHQWQLLQAKWRELANFQGGIGTTDSGLSSGSEGDWFAFGFFDVKDYQDYQKCMAALNDSDFTGLRNFCEIRLLLGQILNNNLDSQIKNRF